MGMSEDEIQIRLRKLHEDIASTITAALKRAGQEQSDVQGSIIQYRQEIRQMLGYLGEEENEEVVAGPTPIRLRITDTLFLHGSWQTSTNSPCANVSRHFRLPELV